MAFFCKEILSRPKRSWKGSKRGLNYSMACIIINNTNSNPFIEDFFDLFLNILLYHINRELKNNKIIYKE